MTRPKEDRDRDEKQVAVWLRADIKDALTAAAKRDGTSHKAVIEAALQSYLEKPQPQGQI